MRVPARALTGVVAPVVASLLVGCSGGFGTTSPRPSEGDAGSVVDAPDASSEAAAPIVLTSESGFFDVPAQPTAATFPARLFYVFHPADEDAAHKPIALVFNGGPGFATSAGLLAFGTGPYSLDAAHPDAPPAANPARWTSFANLLYVDARLAGFSYGQGAAPSDPRGFSPTEDAADFVRALLAFYDQHPELAANPVLVVGESYGGERAQCFFDLVLRYKTRGALGGADLPDRLQAHFDAVFPGRAGEAFDEATIAQQFGRQVLIEPSVAGQMQLDQENAMLAADPYVGTAACPTPTSCDPYDTQHAPGWSDGIITAAMTAVTTDTTSRSLVGAPLASIAALLPAARHGAFHPTLPPSDANDLVGRTAVDANARLVAALGALEPGDAYFAPLAITDWTFQDDPNLFLANLAHVRTFLTDARYDQAILARSIPALIAKAGLGGDVDEAPRPGVARPGWFDVQIANPDGTKGSVAVRFPGYTASGHMVATSQPQELHDDVAAWLAE